MKEKLYDGLIESMEKEFGQVKQFATLEDMLRMLDLEEKPNLTKEEAQELERLKNLSPPSMNLNNVLQS